MKVSVVVLVCCLLCLFWLAGCDQNVAPPGSAPKQGAPQGAQAERPAQELPSGHPPVQGGSDAAGAAAGSRTDSAAGVSWSSPARWVAQGQRAMRAATYRVPPAAGDSEGGECAVFFFGRGQGGDVDANVKRWIGQFEQAGSPKTGRRTLNGMQVTTIDVSGTYAGSGGPMGGGTPEKKPGYRLLGAIVQAPDGAVFFKFTGPEKTVAAAQSEFEAMLGGIRKQ